MSEIYHTRCATITKLLRNINQSHISFRGGTGIIEKQILLNKFCSYIELNLYMVWTFWPPAIEHLLGIGNVMVILVCRPQFSKNSKSNFLSKLKYWKFGQKVSACHHFGLDPPSPTNPQPPTPLHRTNRTNRTNLLGFSASLLLNACIHRFKNFGKI